MQRQVKTKETKKWKVGEKYCIH